MSVLSFRIALSAFLLLGGLGILSIVDIFDGPGTVRQEREARTPALPTSAGEVPRFIAEARHYLANRYALKQSFVTANGAFKLGVFNHSPVPEVMIGNDGFLFLTEDRALRLIQGQDRLTAQESTAWQDHFATLNRRFQTTDIPFVFMIGPNKHSIYPEALPDWITPVSSEKTRSYDILSIAQDHLDLPPVDLTGILKDFRAQTPDMPVYFKTDTHWNELGAALALRAALPDLPTAETAPPVQITRLARGGDMARMTGQQSIRHETAPKYLARHPWTCTDTAGVALELETIDPVTPQRFRCQSPAPDTRHVVVFGDSFSIPAVPFLAASFAQTEFIRTNQVDPTEAQALDADLVIQIIVERKMQSIRPQGLVVQND